MLQELLPLQSLTLLYAEDDDDVRESTQRVLSYYFKDVKVAKNGQEAIEIFNQLPIDIVMLDVKMPYKSGLEVASIIRSNNQYIPIILVSSYHEYQDLILAIRLHVVDYLLKPYDFSTLNNTLLSCVTKFTSQNPIVISLSNTISYNQDTKTLIDTDSNSFHLSKSECMILELLLLYRGKMVSYKDIEIQLGKEYVTLAAIKNIILRLRKKIGTNTIENVPYYGYILK